MIRLVQKHELERRVMNMDSLSFDYGMLRKRIREKYKTDEEFARSIGIGRVSLSGRLNNKLEFTPSEIMKSCEVLTISDNEIPAYFFTKIVQKSERTDQAS